MIWLMFLCALCLSAAAAFYSVVGLMAIFAAAPIPIAVMGSLLEGSKLVIASWLYRNWKDAPKLMKGYLTTALVILMGLTSMGIFGYLSKAHLDQGVPTSDIAAKVAIIDEKIAIEKENINAARKTLLQLDEQVNQTLSRTTNATDDTAVSRSVAIRRNQARERLAISNELERSRAAIAKLNEEKAPIASELRKVEAEVGPIKYIAAIIYGDEATSDATILEKAVRWVTSLIVAVFDPLAVIMLIAANWSLAHRKKNDEPPQIEKSPVEKEPKKEEPVSEEKTILEQHPYLLQPFPHFKVEPLVYKEEPKQEKPKRERSLVKRDEPEPSLEQSQEHPAFIPESKFWGSRPPNHLVPHDPRHTVKVD